MAFDKKEYDQRFQRDHIRRIQLPLNRISDADIITHLDKQRSMSAYLKNLIREDMKKPRQ